LSERFRVTNRVLDDCGECCTDSVLLSYLNCALCGSVFCSVYYSVCSVQRSGLYVCTRQVHIQDMLDDEWQERLKILFFVS
jgi:hypothetical protein